MRFDENENPIFDSVREWFDYYEPDFTKQEFAQFLERAMERMDESELENLFKHELESTGYFNDEEEKDDIDISIFQDPNTQIEVRCRIYNVSSKEHIASVFGYNPEWYEYEMSLHDEDGEMLESWDSLTETYNEGQELSLEQCQKMVEIYKGEFTENTFEEKVKEYFNIDLEKIIG